MGYVVDHITHPALRAGPDLSRSAILCYCRQFHSFCYEKRRNVPEEVELRHGRIDS